MRFSQGSLETVCDEAQGPATVAVQRNRVGGFRQSAQHLAFVAVSQVYAIPRGECPGHTEAFTDVAAAGCSARSGGTPKGRRTGVPSAPGKVLSDATMGKLLRERGTDAVPHGFRSSFRDWAADKTDVPRKVVEAALAHRVRNAVEAA